MGVMTCSRYGCGNIMCETHVHPVGYICDECQEEFKKWAISTGAIVGTSEDIISSLKMFIETDKGEFDNSIRVDTIEDFFKAHTNKHTL